MSSQDNYQGNPGQVFAAVVVDDQVFDLDQFAQVCGVSLEWVSTHVQAGIFNVPGDEPARWQFSGHEIRRARQIDALERDFEQLPELAALVIDLQDEVTRLRALVRRGD
ncbi:MAG: MerR family transcriptional regulator [Propionivibrio sp.]|uniref:MerR family transcriptional regulator n=1 Tax=Propionivibrio sp. TaxID=2212460 RepID=UPI001A5689F9|nr:MerR family transcriptional regulator [Propionivibrio sp.]MBL8412906.1 MerR family transcriptional regulator [Propionivibrio sp.]